MWIAIIPIVVSLAVFIRCMSRGYDQQEALTATWYVWLLVSAVAAGIAVGQALWIS